MRILHTTSEFFPYIKVGGLSDMLSSLSKAQLREHEVHVALPLIKSINHRIEYTGKVYPCIGDDYFGSDASEYLKHSRFYEAKEGNIKLYFFDSPLFRDLYSIYANYNEHYHFAIFSYACYYLGMLLNADLVHSHDWHTSLTTAINASRKDGKPTCFTIHNMAHQGDHPFDMTAFLRIDPFFLKPELFSHLGKVNYMKGALEIADEITTVSPGYRDEILHEPNGRYLSWLLKKREDSLTGILNGIDPTEWNPSVDPHLRLNYNIDTLDKGKRENKLALYQDYGLYVDLERPLIGSVGRLAHQKGIDTFLSSFHWKANLPFYYFVLGKGETKFEHAFLHHSHHSHYRLYYYKGFSEDLAHKIEAACDFFLMPSLFEPCGLNQLYSHAYGAIPIVSRVGGLKDTVHETPDIENFTGFVFEPGQDWSLNEALDRACHLYYDKPRFHRARQNVMSLDWSWEKRVDQYKKLYERARKKKLSQ